MDENLIIKDILSGLVQDAMMNGNKPVLDWLLPKIKSGYGKLYDDILKYATQNSYYESEDYKPNDIVKEYARQYLGPLEEDSGMSEQERGLREAMGEDAKPAKEMGIDPITKREDVPEQARDLWDIMHNDEAINSMRRGM